MLGCFLYLEDGPFNILSVVFPPTPTPCICHIVFGPRSELARPPPAKERVGWGGEKTPIQPEESLGVEGRYHGPRRLRRGDVMGKISRSDLAMSQSGLKWIYKRVKAQQRNTNDNELLAVFKQQCPNTLGARRRLT